MCRSKPSVSAAAASFVIEQTAKGIPLFCYQKREANLAIQTHQQLAFSSTWHPQIFRRQNGGWRVIGARKAESGGRFEFCRAAPDDGQAIEEVSRAGRSGKLEKSRRKMTHDVLGRQPDQYRTQRRLTKTQDTRICY